MFLVARTSSVRQTEYYYFCVCSPFALSLSLSRSVHVHSLYTTGAFKQPKAIYADVDVLQTLPLRELRCGMAEAMKHGLIFDASVFTAITSNFANIVAKDPDTLLNICHNAMRIKGEVVTLDECEGGIRACLNFGHTVGHAVEALSPWLQHGECVGIGMVVEVKAARALGVCSDATVTAVINCVMDSGLPYEVPLENDLEELFRYMSKDKKNIGGSGTIKCVLIDAVRIYYFTDRV